MRKFTGEMDCIVVEDEQNAVQCIVTTLLLEIAKMDSLVKKAEKKKNPIEFVVETIL